MTEVEERQAVVAEALSWIGTPYHANADVKGAGVDCGMILVRSFVDTGERLKALGERLVGTFPEPFDPRPYPNQWNLHQRAERYMDWVRQWAKEVPGPNEGYCPRPGDIVLFHYGLCYAHGGIVVEWPIMLHAMGPSRVQRQSVNGSTMLRGLRKKHFSIWPFPGKDIASV